jgi:hypothetical protein
MYVTIVLANDHQNVTTRPILTEEYIVALTRNRIEARISYSRTLLLIKWPPNVNLFESFTSGRFRSIFPRFESESSNTSRATSLTCVFGSVCDGHRWTTASLSSKSWKQNEVVMLVYLQLHYHVQPRIRRTTGRILWVWCAHLVPEIARRFYKERYGSVVV